MNIADKCVVSIHYTLTDEQGQTLDSSEGQEPLNYLHGANNIIPGLEQALAGKGVGDRLTVTVQPGDAYGEVNPDLIQLVREEGHVRAPGHQGLQRARLSEPSYVGRVAWSSRSEGHVASVLE